MMFTITWVLNDKEKSIICADIDTFLQIWNDLKEKEQIVYLKAFITSSGIEIDPENGMQPIKR